MNKSESKYFNTACIMDEALLRLLEKKDFEFITVKEICATAGVNRSTFYLHYENTYDLLEESMALLNNRFSASFKNKTLESINLKQADKNDLIFITPEYLIPYLTFVKENKRAFKTVYDKPQVFNTKKTFEKMYASIFSPILEKFGKNEQKMPYYFEFYTKGVLAIIIKWVENDCKEPIDFITETIIDCVKPNLPQ